MCRSIHRYTNTLKRKLIKARPPRTFSDTSGAYRIRCKVCKEVYIGQTGRDFQVRLGEHKTAVSHGLERSSVFQHVYEHNYAIDWGRLVNVYNSEHPQNRLVVESALIKENATFNNTQGVVAYDKLSSDFMLRSLPQLGGQVNEETPRDQVSSRGSENYAYFFVLLFDLSAAVHVVSESVINFICWWLGNFFDISFAC